MMNTADIYMQDLARLPDPLTREQEKEASVQDLITHNLKFAVAEAYKFANKWRIPPQECVQEANMGLCVAAQRYDPDKGYRFITYAVHYIYQRLRVFAPIYKETVRLPLNRIKDGERNTYISLEKDAFSDEDESFRPALHNRLASYDPSPLDQVSWIDERDKVNAVLAQLKPREADMLTMQYGLDGAGPATLEEIGQVYGLTRERARQITNQAKERFAKKWHRLTTSAGWGV